MRILSVVSIDVFSIYGYDYMKQIVFRRADNQEYTIVEKEFKDLYPSDFEDLNFIIRQRVEDFQLGIKSYQTQLNLTKPRWEAIGLEFIHDYKILDSPRAVLFRDKYSMQMLCASTKSKLLVTGIYNNKCSFWTIGSGESSRTWKALLVEEYAKETTNFYGEPNDDILSVASRTSCVIVGIEKEAVCSSLRSLKSKRTIESRA
ncbi:hypothetical protein Tco_0217501 [Tanacetum coccineum]